jgi:hypothetical protein
VALYKIGSNLARYGGGLGSNGSSGTDPNPLYSALDMNTIPFHVGAGGWGAQLPFETATPPTITRSANASTLSELQTEMAIAGTRVTITANISSGQVASPANDVEVVLPNGLLVNGVTIGNFGTTIANRIRITKASGDSIGGQWHLLTFTGDTGDNLIVDGIQISGDHAADPALYPAYTTGSNRVAILRNQIIGIHSCFGYGGTNYLLAGNSLRHNAGDVEGGGEWGMRISGKGPHIVVDNDVRSTVTSYAPIRFHPSAGSGLHYCYAARNTTVNRQAGRVIDMEDVESSTSYANMDGGWILNNNFYVNGNVQHEMTRDIGGGATADYCRVNGNTVYGHTTGLTDGGAPDGDDTGNTYNATAGSDPAWGAAGDPTGIDWTP